MNSLQSHNRFLSTQTTKKISELYYARLKFGKVSKIIIFLLNIRPMSKSYIYDFMDSVFHINKKYVQHFIWHLKSRHIITENNSKLDLTTFGKVTFLICDYEINFIQICLLLETFYCQNRMMKERCVNWFYLVSNFTDRVDYAFRPEYVAWCVSQLIKKELIYRNHKGAISLMPRVFDEIMKNYDTVAFFHKWFIEAWRKKRQLILEDPIVICRRRELPYFIKN